MTPLRPAILLDRDGTLVRDHRHGADPAALRLLPGVASACRVWHAAGYALVVVTNQSGIARGLFTAPEALACGTRVAALLRAAGAPLAGYYLAPTHAAARIPGLGADAPPDLAALRKPAPGLPLRAAAELGLDLARSWLVGDALTDVGAARAAGTRPVLLDIGARALPADEVAAGTWDDLPIARSLPHAAALTLAADGHLSVRERPPADVGESLSLGAQPPAAGYRQPSPFDHPDIPALLRPLPPSELVRDLPPDDRGTGRPSPWPDVAWGARAAADAGLLRALLAASAAYPRPAAQR